MTHEPQEVQDQRTSSEIFLPTNTSSSSNPLDFIECKIERLKSSK